MKPVAKPTKDARLHIRCRVEDKEKIEQAARALGLSVSDYLLSSALANASRAGTSTGHLVPREQTTAPSRLSEADTRSLLALVFSGPDEPTPRMRRAVERYNRMVMGVDNDNQEDAGR
jgi:uncharacterized protein (DUF1778 family)